MGDVKLVKDLFRHRDFATTLKYDRTSDVDIERYFDDMQSNGCKSEESGVNNEERAVNKIVRKENLIYSSQSLEINAGDEDGNCSFSFSFSFFVCDVSVTGYGDWVARDRLRCVPFISTLPIASSVDWMSDVCLGWSELEQSSALLQPVFCNPWGDICFPFYSNNGQSFIPRAKHSSDLAGGDDSVLSFFITFFPPNDFFSVAPACSPDMFVGERVVSEVMW
jgi:hypothetical protein